MSAELHSDLVDIPPVSGVRHRFVRIRGTCIHVAEAGSPDAPPIVLLHGFPQHWYAWRDVISGLAEDRHVLAVDLPGFGWSEPSVNGYATSERVLDVLDVLDAMELDTVDLAGHDWGAWLAFRIALDNSERVRRLVAISEIHPWPLQRRLVPNLWRMWVTALLEAPGLGSLVQRDHRVVRWFLTRDAVEEAVWTDELIDVYASRVARPDVARAGRRLHSAFVLHDIARLVLGRDRHREFDVPSLLIAGSHDV